MLAFIRQIFPGVFFLQARFPFLDEDVVQTLLNFPLWDIAVLEKPSGIGDKKILREVCPSNWLDISLCSVVFLIFVG